jgi:hypothetical protein
MRKLIAATAAAVAFALATAAAAPVTDGTYLVGSDIAPGTYRTAGPSDGAMFCYWERDKNTDGTLDSIIANDNSAGPTLVTVKAHDVAFKTQFCQPWTLVGR